MGNEKAKSTSAGNKKQIRKGKVHLGGKKTLMLHTSKGLFPTDVLNKYEVGREASQQLSTEDMDFFKKKGLKPHPFEANTMLDFKESNVYFDACVRQIAKDVLTPAWRLVPIEEKVEDEAEKERATEFLQDPNDLDESLERVIEKLIVDWGMLGWTALEISRDGSDMVNGMWHIPAQTIFSHLDKVRFAQARGTKKKWFKRFGTEQNISSITGEPIKTPKNKAHEVIWYTNYYPRSDYYGAPNILSALGAVIGMLGVRDYNLAFFENFGVPAGLVTLEGEWEENSVDDIRDFIDTEIRGSQSAFKTIVLELPEGGKAVWQALAVDIKEGSFTVWIKQLREEILVAYRMPPYRIGIAEAGSLGGSIAEEATEIYNQSIIEPLKKDWSDLITRTILKKGLGITKYRFELQSLDLRNLEQLTIIWDRLFKLACINPNWIRGKIGEEPRDDGLGDEYYLSSSLAPVGGDALEKRERAMDAWMEDTSLSINEKIKTLTEAQKAIQGQMRDMENDKGK